MDPQATQTPTTTPPQQPVSPPHPAFSKNKMLYILGAIFIVAVIGVGGYFLGKTKSAPPPVAPTPTNVPKTSRSSRSSRLPEESAGKVVVTGKADTDITYCTSGGVDLKLDLYHPTKAAGTAALVVYVHGGGWSKGTKDAAKTFQFIADLLDNGFYVASLDHRMAPEYPFPAQIIDVKCAIRFLRAHASDYGYSANKIGASGTSTGAHLVNLLGVTDKSAGFDSGQYLDQSSAVEAVVPISGPTDITSNDFLNVDPDKWQEVLQNVFSNSSDLAAKASPIRYVSSGDPAFLILHGDIDKVVPVSQAQTFYDALKKAGVDATIEIVHGAGHGVHMQIEQAETTQELNKKIVDFFNSFLR